MKLAIKVIGGLMIFLFISAISIGIGGTLIELILYDDVLHKLFYAKLFYTSALTLFIGIAIFFFYNLNYNDL